MEEEPRLHLEDSELGRALRDAKELGPSEAERMKIIAGLGGILGPPPSGGGSGGVGSGAGSGTEAAASGASAGASVALLKWAAAVVLVLVGGVVWGLQTPDAPSQEVSFASVAAPVEGLRPAEAPARSIEVHPSVEAQPADLPARSAVAEPSEVEPVFANGRHEGRARSRSTSSRPATTRPATAARSFEGAARERASRGTAEATRPGSVDMVETDETENPSSSELELLSGAHVPETQGPTELGLLAEARRVLRSAPSQTLRLTAQHRARFSEGALVEEREVLAIEALVRLSRQAQAVARAERFQRRFPRSIHTTRLSAVLAP